MVATVRPFHALLYQPCCALHLQLGSSSQALRTSVLASSGESLAPPLCDLPMPTIVASLQPPILAAIARSSELVGTPWGRVRCPLTTTSYLPAPSSLPPILFRDLIRILSSLTLHLASAIYSPGPDGVLLSSCPHSQVPPPGPQPLPPSADPAPSDTTQPRCMVSSGSCLHTLLSFKASSMDFVKSFPQFP